MATLTWQDVAGQVRAPDYSEATALITRGISGLGESVAAIGSAPEKRRQEQLAKESALIGMQQQSQREVAQTANQLGNVLKQERKEKDMEAFGSIQSILEAGSREAAIKGVSLNDFLKTSDDYLKLSAGARALGAAHLSDAYNQGLTIREQQADNARQERHFQIQLAESRRQQAAANSRFEREFKLRERELTERNRKEREDAGFISDDPLTNVAWRERAAQTKRQLAPLQRAVELYGDMTPDEAAKKGKLFSSGKEAQAIAQELEKKTGKKVETWMINQLLVEGGGANSIVPFNDFNDSAAEDYLLSLIKQTDAARANQIFFDEMTQLAREGKRFSPEVMKNYPVQTGIDIAPPKKRREFKAPRAGRE